MLEKVGRMEILTDGKQEREDRQEEANAPGRPYLP